MSYCRTSTLISIQCIVSTSFAERVLTTVDDVAVLHSEDDPSEDRPHWENTGNPPGGTVG